jgi:hypothetical protein
MTRFTPLWQQAGSYAAQVDRQLLAALYPGPGAYGAPAAAVTNTMNVSIPPGRATVPLQAGANSALCTWDAAEAVTSPTAPASGNSRIDVVALQVRDPQLDAGVNNDFIFQVLVGTPTTGTPVAPAVPANAIAVCQYTVPGAVANLNGVTITDLRVGIGPPWVVANTAALPAPVRGMLAYNASDDGVYYAAGNPPAWKSYPKGKVAYVESSTGGTIGTAMADLVSVTFTGYTNRRYVARGFFSAGPASANLTLNVALTDGANSQFMSVPLAMGSGAYGSIPIEREMAVTAGLIQWKMRAAVSTGSASINAGPSQPYWLRVDDVGV